VHITIKNYGTVEICPNYSNFVSCVCVFCFLLWIVITYFQCPVSCIPQASSNVFNDQFSSSNLQRQGIIISLPALKFSFKHLYLLIFLILLSSAIFFFHSFCLYFLSNSSLKEYSFECLVYCVPLFPLVPLFQLHVPVIIFMSLFWSIFSAIFVTVFIDHSSRLPVRASRLFLLFLYSGPFRLVHDHLH
jgi:hypothetical protein